MACLLVWDYYEAALALTHQRQLSQFVQLVKGCLTEDFTFF